MVIQGMSSLWEEKHHQNKGAKHRNNSRNRRKPSNEKKINMMDLPGIFNPIHQNFLCLSDLRDSSFLTNDRCGRDDSQERDKRQKRRIWQGWRRLAEKGMTNSKGRPGSMQSFAYKKTPHHC
ncbi:MAG: hypothetical protein ACLFQS_06210 [Bacteroidales bacterium]